jgi:hypothetical protein
MMMTRIDADTGRIIELDIGKEYDNGNTGSSYIDATIPTPSLSLQL